MRYNHAQTKSAKTDNHSGGRKLAVVCVWEAMTPQEVVKSLTLTYTEQNLLAAGYCPKCEQPIRGEFIPVPDGAGFMRPEIYEALREGGIDSASGHKANCELKGLRLP